MNDLNLLIGLSSLERFFTKRSHRVIYSALKRLYRSGADLIDMSDVYALIETNNKHLEDLEDDGGISLLEVIYDMGEDKTLKDITPHITNIKTAALKNEMSKFSENIESTVENNISMQGLFDFVETNLLEMKGKYSDGKKMELLGDRMDKLQSELDREANKEFSGFPTGYSLLDQYITYEKGEMVIYSAPAKFGKSQWVVDMVYNLCILKGVPIAVIDTELSDRFFMVRLIARISNLSFKFIKSGKYKEYSWAIKKYNEAYETIKNSTLYHEYTVGWSDQQIKDELKRIKIQNNVQIVVWDYIKINEIDENAQERLALAKLTNFLKNEIAGEFNMAVVALAQTSDYKGEDGLKIFGSNQIKQYCSTVIFMIKKTKELYSRDYEEMGGNIYMFVKYNRNGAEMSDESMGINFTFDRTRATFALAKFQHEEIKELPVEHNEED